MSRTTAPRTRTLLATLTLAALIAPASAFAGVDVDGDGLDDLLIGARRADDTAPGGGLAALGLGGASLEPGELLTPPVGTNARAGTAVALGDFNCDGLADYAVGAPLDASEEGRVYVYLSTAEGHELHTYVRGQLAYSAADQAAGDHFGRALAVADFDGDQCDDLAIGAPGATSAGGLDATGVVYVTHGEPNGPAQWRNLRPDAGPSFEHGKYGFSLSAGDVDGDGAPDLVIGAPRVERAGTPVGAVQVRRYDDASDLFEHHFTALTPCDAGGCDAADGDRWFGWATAVGDFDGDGEADIAVGRPGEEGQLWSGEVIVYDDTGDYAAAQTIALGGGADLFGFALAAGDLDGDGGDDLVIGSPLTSLAGQPDATGAAYVLTDSLSATQVLSPADYQSPTADNQKFGAALSLGNYYGGGLDLAVGASRAKDGLGVRSGGVYTYVNDEGAMTGVGKITLDAWLAVTNAGALFGSALAQ